jgi:uncharacterized membrane protein
MQALGVIAIIAIVGVVMLVAFVGVVVQQFWPLLILAAVAWAVFKFMRYYRRDDSYGAPPPLPPDHYRS